MKLKFNSINEYQKYFSELIELERKEEILTFKEEIKKMSPKEREEKGRALLGMKATKKERGLGGRYIVKFKKIKDKFFLAKTEISVGDVVVLSQKNPLSKEVFLGTVVKKTNFSISIAFDKEPPDFILKKKVRIDLYVNDVTFQRMLSALFRLKKIKTKKQKELRKIILGQSFPKFLPEREITFENKNLNYSQKKATKRALSAQNIFLIHGPPGTGKTTTLVEIIEQLAKEKNKILVSAESNVAVDNILEALIKRGKDVIRIGHPARISVTLRKYCLDYLVQNLKEYKQIEKLRKQIEKIKENQKDFLFPSKKQKRGLSDREIKKLAKKGKTKRKILKENIKSMAQWLEFQEVIDYLRQRIKILEKTAINKILKKAQIICTTNSTAGSELLENERFDVAVIDEATQTLEPCCLIPILLSKKVIMAGDHKQLPPTVLSPLAKKKGLEFSLFERMIILYGDKIKEMLNIQYRMADKIMEFPAQKFYQGKLKSADFVANQKMEKIETQNPFFNEILDPEKNIVFLDTRGKFKEKTKGESKSKENLGEAKIIKELVEILLKNISPQKIGIISPYEAQIDLLKGLLNVENLEIKTVDGFQGREKGIIFLSLVRSNEKGELGFLEDLRRLNVSLTRAKKKLIIVGDSQTLSKNKIYKDLIDYIKEKEGYFLI